MRRRTALIIGAAALMVVLALVAALLVMRARTEDARDDAARAAVDRLANQWSEGDLGDATLSDADGAQESYTALVEGLGSPPPTVVVDAVTREDDAATADLTVTWPLGTGWSYTTTTELTPVDADELGGRWAAEYSPALVHPDLADGDRLSATRSAAARGDLLGRDGAPLVTEQPVVDVGVQPSRLTDRAGTTARLGELLGIDAAALTERVTAADPNAFVPVITLRRPDYDRQRDQLQPLPGVVFRESTALLAPTREFARALVGSVGPASQEVVDASEGRVVSGDTTGLSGLQREYDEALAGTPGVRVELLPADDAAAPDDAAADDGAAPEPVELFAEAPVDGVDLPLTVDPRVQLAADAALGAAAAAGRAGNGNASLVAVDVPTGDVLAVANTPATGGDRALTGQYPPGSTFKAVSTLALLGTGLDVGEVVPCPPTAAVEGRSFRNFEGGAAGDVPFRQDFAQSCNTAFVGLSSRLDAQALADAGASVGLGGTWRLGTDAFTGSVPTDGSGVDVAAATIGQGRVLASPAAMAVAVSTIARGSWVAPELVGQPAGVPPEEAPAPAGTEPAPDAARLGVVRDLMREVAVSGTAGALADVPGAPVHAKTGTAEYGSDSPPRTHAWTIGFQGDVAWALVVEDGASGGSVAVPVAEDFLRRLAG